MHLNPKNLISLVALASLTILVFQNCAGGAGTPNSPSASSIFGAAMSSQPILSAESTTLLSNYKIAFHVTGLPAGASVSWNNTLNQNAPCLSEQSAVPHEYILICPLAGTLVVASVVNAPGVNPIFLQDSFHLGTGPAMPPGPNDPTPTPAPTPKPATGQLLADQQVYTANCARCHGDVDYSSKRGTTRFATDVAIINNVGKMGVLSTLSSTERDQIIFALNNVQP